MTLQWRKFGALILCQLTVNIVREIEHVLEHSKDSISLWCLAKHIAGGSNQVPSVVEISLCYFVTKTDGFRYSITNILLQCITGRHKLQQRKWEFQWYGFGR
jgi:hypothetical protein